MFGRNVGLAALAASVGLALAGCSAGGDQHDSAPPPSDYRAEASPPELMGAAPAPNADQAPDGLLGGPTSSGSVSSQALPPPDPNIKTWRRADGTLVTAMRPVPNPGARHAGRAASTPPQPSTAWTQRADVAAVGDTRTWRRADGTLVTAMRPVANPGAQRQARAASSPRVYAHAAPRRHATIPTEAAPVARAAPKPAPKPSVVAAAPKPAVKPVPAKPAPAKPAAVATAQKPATVKPEVVKPVTPKTVAPAPAPLKAVKPAEPTTPLAKPPVVAATPPAEPPKAAKPTGKLEQLQAAVATEATNGAVLAAGESLSKNQPGQVTLSLPVTLGDLIKKEAAKLGLTKAASKTSAYAQLSGEGYEVTPNGRQTAAVTPGEPATFAWQVKPGPDAKGQLKTEFGVALNGAKPAQEFALGTITKRVAAAPEAVQKAVKDVDFGSLNKTVVLPGLGQTSLKTVLGAALVLLAVIILAVVSRNASESRRRAERQRKFRARNDFGPSAMDVEPADHGVERPREPAPDREHHVNPFVAAAGGALVGAAATAAFNHHRDEQKAEEHHDPFPAQAEPSSVVEPPHAAPVEHVNAPAEHVQAVQPAQAATEAAPAPVEHTPFTFPPSETSSAPHVAEPHTPPQADGHGTRETKEHEPA